MREPFEKDRSLKKLQSQIAGLERDHPSYPEVVINLVNGHNRRQSLEKLLTHEICNAAENDACYLAIEQAFSSPAIEMSKMRDLDDYLRDAISRFVNNEL